MGYRIGRRWSASEPMLRKHEGKKVLLLRQKKIANKSNGKILLPTTHHAYEIAMNRKTY